MRQVFVTQPTVRRRSQAAAQRHHSAVPPTPSLLVQRKSDHCACGGSCPRCQAKSSLTIGPADDIYEREADRVADRIMRMPDGDVNVTPAASSLQRKCEACEKEDEEHPVQLKRETDAALAHVSPDMAGVTNVLHSAGRPLSPAVRAFFEPRFGREFSGVRVHTDAAASRSARDLSAAAYTVGHHVVFGHARYSPDTNEGQRLIAHELAHVVQQSSARATPAVQRQRAAAPRCPTSIVLSSGSRAVHVPACGPTPVRASQRPARTPVTWSLTDGSTQPGFPGAATTVASGTTISNAPANAGTITVAASQTPGFIVINADGAPGCTPDPSGATGRTTPLNFASTPTGVAATSIIGALTTSATEYGARFSQTLNSASGNPAHLLQVRVNEHFPLLPTPDAATHTFPTPFGRFTLHTNRWTPNSDAPGWDIDANGVMKPDNIGIDRAMIDVGRFVSSASNPTPATTLTPSTPVGFSVQQDLHWFCPQAAVGSQWISPPFASLTHTRHLWQTAGDITFLTGIPAPSLAVNSEPYTGQPAIINATASPNPVTVSPTRPRGAPRGTPPPTPNTTTVTADTLPSSTAALTGTHDLRFSIRGPARGCRVDARTGVVTVGTTAGTIIVRVRDVNRNNRNFDEVTVTIVAATAPSPSPTSPTSTLPTTPHPGLHVEPNPDEVVLPPPLPVTP